MAHHVTVPLDLSAQGMPDPERTITLGCLCRVGHDHLLDDTKDD